MKRLVYLLGLLFASVCLANVIRVPEDLSDIHLAFDSDADSILIGSGIYSIDNLNIISYGKTVIGVCGPDSTILDGGFLFSGIFCYGGEINGITFRNFGTSSAIDSEYYGAIGGYGSLTVVKCKFINCVQTTSPISYGSIGAAIQFRGYGDLAIRNCLIQDCSTDSYSAMYCRVTNSADLPYHISNCTIMSYPEIGFFYGDNLSELLLIVDNSIWTGQIHNLLPIHSLNRYGFNYWLSDPLFTLDGRFNLSAGSPCIDAGDPNSPLDPDGTRTDIGAFYYCQGEGIRLPDIVRTSTEPGYPEPITATLQSTCDPVAIDSARTTTGLFTLDSYPSQVAGEFKSGDFQLTFHPTAQGIYTDTLHIWANTDPPHHKIPLVGEAGPIPVPVTDLSIGILPDLSAQLTWSPVTQTIYGNPVTPDYYLIFYNEDNPLNDADWYYLYPATGTTYTHPLVARFASLMNYRVVAWKGIDPALLGWEVGMKIADLERLER